MLHESSFHFAVFENVGVLLFVFCRPAPLEVLGIEGDALKGSFYRTLGYNVQS